MSSTLAGPVLIACATLALAGAAKVVAPDSTGRALQGAGLPHPPLAVRGLGLGEILLAIAAVVGGGHVLPVLVGAAYLAFAGFVILARRHGAVSSCGCFGATRTPPSPVHVVVNLAIAAVCIIAGIGGLASIGDVLADQPAFGLPFLAFAVAGTYAVVLALTMLPLVLDPPVERARNFSINPTGGSR